MSWGGLNKAVANATQNLSRRRKALLAEVGEVLVNSTMQRFDEGIGPDGKPWEPSLRAAASGGKTLLDKARLRNSISSLATADAVYVGSNLIYALIHQEGGQAGRGHSVTIKKRPYLGVSEEDAEEIAAVLRDYLAGSFEK